MPNHNMNDKDKDRIDWSEIPEGPENAWTPDLDDRRRIAEQAVLMHLEREGSILSGPWGQIVLNHAIAQDEVIPLSDALNKSIAKRMMRGMI